MAGEEMCRVNFRCPESVRDTLEVLAARSRETLTGMVIRLIEEEKARQAKGEGLQKVEPSPYDGKRKYVKCYTRSGKCTRYEVVRDMGEPFLDMTTREEIEYVAGNTQEEWWSPAEARAVNSKPYDHDFFLIDKADLLDEVLIYYGPPRSGVKQMPNNPAVARAIQMGDFDAE